MNDPKILISDWISENYQSFWVYIAGFLVPILVQNIGARLVGRKNAK